MSRATVTPIESSEAAAFDDRRAPVSAPIINRFMASGVRLARVDPSLEQSKHSLYTTLRYYVRKHYPTTITVAKKSGVIYLLRKDLDVEHASSGEA